MIIHRILNNNSVVVLNEENEEEVLTGKGLAFKKKVGDIVNEWNVTQVFKLSTSDNKKMQQLLESIPIEYIDLGEEVVKLVEASLGRKLNTLLFVSLSDHIYSSVTRFKEGIHLRNSILWELKRYYSSEYEAASKSVEIINETFNITMPEDEVGFITMHIINAEMDESNMSEIIQITSLIQEIINLVKYFFKVEFDTESIYYFRFLTHVKFFSQRIVLKKIEDETDNDRLFEMIQSSYSKSWECVGVIEKFLLSKYSYKVSKDEKVYLTIHVERLIAQSLDSENNDNK